MHPDASLDPNTRQNPPTNAGRGATPTSKENNHTVSTPSNIPYSGQYFCGNLILRFAIELSHTQLNLIVIAWAEQL